MTRRPRERDPRPRIPWHAWLLLLRPRRIAANLHAARRAGVVDRAPNLWQIELGVLRMWHRLVTRPDTVGTCAAHPVRPTLRARLLHARPIRLPFLLWERAIAPLDMSGLASSPERIVRHLLAAHHDGNQLVYDLELLSCHPHMLEALRDRARAVVEGRDPRSRWLADLVVFENYHEQLLAAVEQAIDRGITLSPQEADDPDISFRAYLAWCAARPDTPAATLRALRRGELTS